MFNCKLFKINLHTSKAHNIVSPRDHLCLSISETFLICDATSIWFVLADNDSMVAVQLETLTDWPQKSVTPDRITDTETVRSKSLYV